MASINLDDRTIHVDGQWVGPDALSERIQQKIAAGDFKIARLAGALEELTKALERAVTVDVTIRLAFDEIERLVRRAGGVSEAEAVRKAVLTVVRKPYADAAAPQSRRPAPPPPSPGAERDKNDAPGDSGRPEAPPTASSKEPVPGKTVVTCAFCNASVTVSDEKRPLIVECPSCGMSGRLTVQNQWSKL